MMKVFGLLVIFMLAGCEMLNEHLLADDASVENEEVIIEPVVTASYETLVEELVTQLVNLKSYQYSEQNTIVSTFVWNESLTAQNDITPLSSLGLHLAEQTKFHLVQKEVKIIEAYGSQALSMSDEGTYFLSRDLDELYSHLDANYIVTGVMSKQKLGVMVNAYVVDFETKLIVGSAQQLFPHSIFENENSVTQKKGKLYISRG